MSYPPAGLVDLLRSAGLASPEGADPAAFERADAKEYLFDPERTVAMLAERLGVLHALEVHSPGLADDVPHVSMRDVVADAARATAAAPDAPLDAAYSHMDRPALLEVLDLGADRLGEAGDGDVVLTHGSPSLGTLLCSLGSAVGFTCWDDMAIADRHRDLARVASSLSGTVGPMILPVFFEHYGRHPGLARLDWWLLAEQLLGPLALGDESDVSGASGEGRR